MYMIIIFLNKIAALVDSILVEPEAPSSGESTEAPRKAPSSADEATEAPPRKKPLKKKAPSSAATSSSCQGTVTIYILSLQLTPLIPGSTSHVDLNFSVSFFH